MFHANTRRLIDYWTATKADEVAPARADVEPGALTTLLPQVFILGRCGSGAFRFRLVGGFVGDLHGADLRDCAFVELWRQGSRSRIQSALEALTRSPRPLVACAEVWPTDGGGEPVDLEIALLPLAPDHHGVERVFGLYQPTDAIARLQGCAAQLTLMSLSPADPLGRPALKLIVSNGVRLDQDAA